jgi:riboflavin synthase
MFTGLVTACEPLLGLEPVSDSVRIRVANPYGTLSSGESIAVNGVCLTVERFDDSEMSFFASPETLRRTALGDLRPGTRLNLERALLASERLGGHVVQGHVDGVGRILQISPEGEAFRLEVELPVALVRYCVPKGSICLDGVSLTINEVLSDQRIWIQIIPHTWAQTRLHTVRAGDPVNVEVDVIAKYVERLCQPYSTR